MTKTIVVCGYGPGISEALARRFGHNGFNVALVARRQERVERGAAALSEAGIAAHGFACDLGDAAAVRALMGRVRDALGPITVIHWNAYAALAGDVLASDVTELRAGFDVAVSGLVVAVQECHGEMKAQEHAAVLVTGGGFALYDATMDGLIVSWKAMGLAIAKAAQHKLVGLLRERLAPDGIYVGEVVVLGLVKGTAFDSGGATLEPDAIAERFWTLYRERSESSVTIA
jgi:NADP-dependent 3-hydroxy acid dehydrogenase YdfG